MTPDVLTRIVEVLLGETCTISTCYPPFESGRTSFIAEMADGETLWFTPAGSLAATWRLLAILHERSSYPILIEVASATTEGERTYGVNITIEGVGEGFHVEDLPSAVAVALAEVLRDGPGVAYPPDKE